MRGSGSGPRPLPIGAVDADLVVDATGRGSRAPLWLEELGYARPVTEKVTVDVGYASRSYQLPHDILGNDKLILHRWTQAYPPQTTP